MAAEAVSMAVEADTAEADTGNSPRFIQESAGTAGSICCQPFSIVRQLLVTVRDNPFLLPTRLHFFFLLIPDFWLSLTDHCLLGEGSGGGRRSISVGTAIERAPFLPTARTAKK